MIEESRLEDIERKAQNSEQNFQKMKTAYSALRQEHINVILIFDYFSLVFCFACLCFIFLLIGSNKTFQYSKRARNK